MIFEIVLTGRRCVIVILLIFAIGYLLLIGLLSKISINRTNSVDSPVKGFPVGNWKPPGKNYDHLHVFVQLSDLHLSAFHEKERISDLFQFCSKILPVIKPEVVMLTGDITDAKLENLEGSTQILDEWKEYANILSKSHVLEKTIWLDTRGNHDVFDVPALDSKTNLFKVFSVQGQNETLSYHHKHKTNDGDVISFIAIDACLNPGPKRPFNFFGMLQDTEIRKIKGFVDDSTLNSNVTIFFGHYPTSVISSHSSSFIRNLLSSGIAYFCGHFHTFAGLVTQMYVYQNEGFLELELGDWKHERLYRVIALDHGFLSFVDNPYGKFPVVLLTNPKDEQFIVKNKEPVENIKDSTHIRILVFSPLMVNDVSVVIDDVPVGKAEHVKDSLYVLPWNAENYKHGIHHITVTASDSSSITTLRQRFSLDGSHSGFTFLQRFIIVMDHTFFLKSLFAFVYVMTMFPLIFFKYFKLQIVATTQSRLSRCLLRSCQRWIRRFCLLANHPKLFYSLLVYNLYLVSGPWFVGYILSDHIGLCFLYGIFINGHFLQTSLTYLYGVLQMIQFNIPLTFYLAYVLDCTITEQIGKNRRNSARFWDLYHHWSCKVVKYIINHLVFFVVILFQAYLLFSGFLRSYGFLAFLICPMRTGAIILALFLHYLLVISSHSTLDEMIDLHENESCFCKVSNSCTGCDICRARCMDDAFKQKFEENQSCNDIKRQEDSLQQ